MLKLFIYSNSFFLVFLNTLKHHIFEYLRFFVSLKDDIVKIKTSVFQVGTPFLTFNYSTHIFLLRILI